MSGFYVMRTQKNKQTDKQIIYKNKINGLLPIFWRLPVLFRIIHLCIEDIL